MSRLDVRSFTLGPVRENCYIVRGEPDLAQPGAGPDRAVIVDPGEEAERLQLAGMDIEVLFTPGHSPGHLTYAITPASSGTGAAGAPTEPALFSGDVLFAGSVGRVDLPGGDWSTLERSIGELLRRFPEGSRIYPGHMGVTTLGRERDTNPFLAELRSAVRVKAGSEAGAAGS